MPNNLNKKTTSTQQKLKESIKQHSAITIPKWTPFAIVIYTTLLYTKAPFNTLTTYDDEFYIVNNPFIRDFSLHGIKAIFTSFYQANYHPLTTIIWLLIYKCFTTSSLPYHLLNVLLHLLNTTLVFILAERLSGKKITAFVVALLFAVHPMHVESVAWASELKDVLYSFFYLSSLILYLHYTASGFRAIYYISMILLFVAALLSKSAAVTLPVLLIIIDLYIGRKVNAKSLIEKAPLFLLSLLFGILAIHSQQSAGAITDLMISYSPINRFFIFTSGLAFYFLSVIAPVNLCTSHYFPFLQDGFLPIQYYGSLPVILFIVWIITRRNAYRKEMLFGMSFFIVAISVMLQAVPVGSSFTSERYTYIPYLGLFYIAGQLISNIVEKKQYKDIAIGLFSIFIIMISIQTWNRIEVWKNDRALYTDLVNKNPYFYFGYSLMGNVEKKDGNLQAALYYYTKSINLNPEYDDAFYNRGVVNDALGNFKPAIQDYSKSIKLNPIHPDAYNNRGWDYYQLSDTRSAIQDYNKAIGLKPDYDICYNNRAWAYDQSGDTAAALRDYSKAIDINPQYSKPIYNRAALKLKINDFNGAIQDFSLLLKLQPDNSLAHLYRGKAYLGLNDMQSACTDWQKAKALGNKNAENMIQQYCQ